MTEDPKIHWTETGAECSARWRSESAAAPPKRIVIANDQMTADAAYRLASEGTAMLWRGDFHNAKQLMQAIARRVDRKTQKPTATPIDAFNQHRQAQAQRARGTRCVAPDEIRLHGVGTEASTSRTIASGVQPSASAS